MINLTPEITEVSEEAIAKGEENYPIVNSFFTNSKQFTRMANIANFVLAVPLEIN